MFALNFDGRRSLDFDLDRYLKTYSKDSQFFGTSRYSVEFYGRRSSNYFGIPRDARYFFVLKRGRYVISCIGFDEADGILVVKQIQGKAFLSSEFLRELKSIRWQRMLLRILSDWAENHGFRQIWVQRAEDNAYWNIRFRIGNVEEKRNKHQQRLRIHYNKTASEEGFRLMIVPYLGEEPVMYYVKDLQTITS